MKLVPLIFTAIVCLAHISTVDARGYGNRPCSGKAGGVSHCTKDGKFVCADGRISKSKRVCRSEIPNPTFGSIGHRKK